MRVAISNIAWTLEEDPIAADLLAAAKVDAVEIAPTVVWPDLAAVTPADARRYREWWNSRGIEIVAFQSLLFGQPDLIIFHSQAQRESTLRYLATVFRLAEWLGAGPLVFGSPKNRLAGHLDRATRDQIAVAFFREAGRRAADHGVVLCIEPNPPEYGCDYVTRAEEAGALAAQVDHPGFGVHLDAAGLHLVGEPVDWAIEQVGPWLRHWHASEPFLAPLGSGGVDHQAAADGLRTAGYRGIVSLEMRRRPEADRRVELAEAIARLRAWYSSSGE